MEKSGLTEAEEKMLAEFEATKQPEISEGEIYEGIVGKLGTPEFNEEVQKLVVLNGEANACVTVEKKRHAVLGLICFSTTPGQRRDREIELLNMIPTADTWNYFLEGDLIQYPDKLRAMTAVELVGDARFPTLTKEMNELLDEFVERSGSIYVAHPRDEIAYALAMSFEKHENLAVRLDLLINLYVAAVNSSTVNPYS